MSVLCKDCVFLKTVKVQLMNPTFHCKHPNAEVDRPVNPVTGVVWRRSCEDRNTNLNCPDFEQRSTVGAQMWWNGWSWVGIWNKPKGSGGGGPEPRDGAKRDKESVGDDSDPLASMMVDFS